MRDILNDLDRDPIDPAASIRAEGRKNLPKRFYKEVSTRAGDSGFEILLDGRSVKTPARVPLAVPTQALADAVAAEWAAQEQLIDPMTMSLTRLVNVALDGVANTREEVADEIVRYMGSDLLLYRAEGPEGLVARQAEHWDPVLAWLDETYGARFFLAEGIRHVAQPEDMVARVAAALPREDVLALAALSTLTALTGSAFLAVALLGGRLDADAAWKAAHVDEDWTIERWGEDAEATARRTARELEMRAAVRLLDLRKA
ncbi:ATPase [Azorhizobium oxalatiphilum]|uniref:ATPase n=1 Tax=Azorhizobium oxalatiphilum TaxID=980631 RepID=A0A917C1D6_9HYPH|nr:ATP12 family protein [Azorhizobium oxalatiphilum]GGF63331.1 ATPase [Azorhizobium oxalatiphilum]